MKILLFGKNGQVARRLQNTLLPLGQIIVYGSSDIDFRNFGKLRDCIRTHNPDIIINTAAYTYIDKAESDTENVFAINTEAVKIIAEEAEKVNAWLIHYSTDYVFDGTKNGAYKEDDSICPVSVYGKSKALADEYIQSINKKYIILRTSWVFDSYGKNFLKTILTLAQKNESLSIVDDQIGAPTSAVLIANVTAFILYKIITNSITETENLKGIYNLSASGEVSWYGFAYAFIKYAQYIGAKLNCLPENIIPIVSKDYKTAAQRPLNSRLDTTKINQKFGLVMPKWDLYIPSCLDELKIMGII